MSVPTSGTETKVALHVPSAAPTSQRSLVGTTIPRWPPIYQVGPSATYTAANTTQIEENNDPRDSVMFADDHGEGDGNDNDSMPDLEEAPPHAHPLTNPWATDDPDEGDISNVQLTQTAPGRINLRATFTQSVSPQQYRAAGGVAPASVGGFMQMLSGIAGAATRQQGQGQGLFSGPDPNQGQSAFNEARSQGGDGQPQIRATRFAYHGGARLYPRDANNPEPHIEPVDEITK